MQRKPSTARSPQRTTARPARAANCRPTAPSSCIWTCAPTAAPRDRPGRARHVRTSDARHLSARAAGLPGGCSAPASGGGTERGPTATAQPPCRQEESHGIDVICVACSELRPSLSPRRCLPGADVLRCPPDWVKVGDGCIDEYPVEYIADPFRERGARQKEFQLRPRHPHGPDEWRGHPGGSVHHVAPHSRRPSTRRGNWTSPLFAVSVAGVPPTSCVTWFQAEQARALSGKRLLTNQEWQRAAAGTPDPGTDDGGTDSNVGGLSRPLESGSRAKCTSNWGAFDWSGTSRNGWPTGCRSRLTAPGGVHSATTLMCLAGASTTATGPGALVRGGFFSGVFIEAGVFAVDNRPTSPAWHQPGRPRARVSASVAAARASALPLPRRHSRPARFLTK